MRSTYEDQVPRLVRFREEHPDIRIIPPGRTCISWTAHRRGVLLAQDIELSGLLDKLEATL
jgi:hypothetical protein